MHHQKQHPVPLLSVSMNTDPNNYVHRLIMSVDYEVSQFVVQIGHVDRAIVEAIAGKARAAFEKQAHLIKSYEIIELSSNPGSARGFNFGLRTMMNPEMHHPSTHSATAKTTNVNARRSGADWVLVVNNDIAFYPGILRRVAKHAYKSLHHNSTFGVGFTSLCCGGEWSAVVFTKRLVEKVGFFDENFYPAYYEDDDYGIRIHHSGFKAQRWDNTPLLHGTIDGSKDYLSGLFVQLYLHPDKSAATDAWRKSHEAGVSVSKAYIEAKWGVNMGGFKMAAKLDCKTLQGLNEGCKTGFTLPFNGTTPHESLSSWKLLNETIQRMVLAATTPQLAKPT